MIPSALRGNHAHSSMEGFPSREKGNGGDGESIQQLIPETLKVWQPDAASQGGMDEEP